MVQIVCPMCGKFSSADFKTPDDGGEIYSVQVRGLGRGLGVRVEGTENILESGVSAVDVIKSRLLVMIKRFKDAGVISEDDLEEIFDLEIYEDVSSVIDDIESVVDWESDDGHLGDALKNGVDKLIREYTTLEIDKDEY